MKELGKDKGSSVPNKEKIGTLTKAQIKKIAEMKFADLNAACVEAAMSTIMGTARSMGVNVLQTNACKSSC